MNDCIPPHARALPVMSSGELESCPECQRRIASLEGLLDATRRDRQALRDEVLRLRAELEARP